LGGIFGVPIAHFCAVEVQGRGFLNPHFIVVGGTSPSVLQHLVINNEHLSAIEIKPESMVKTEIDNVYPETS